MLEHSFGLMRSRGTETRKLVQRRHAALEVKTRGRQPARGRLVIEQLHFINRVRFRSHDTCTGAEAC